MSRPLRLQLANAAYHVTCRGIRKDAIFFNDRDRLEFIHKMNEAFAKYSFVLMAYCLMPSHYHLFLQTPLPNLSAGLHWLNAAYANWLKSRHKLVGHIFQGRFKSILVETETYAINLSIYIHLNPCRWRLTKRPEDYAWSSCRDYLGIRAPQTPALETRKVLSILDTEESAARAGYRTLLRERRDMDDPLKQAFRRIALGSPAFIDRIRQIVNQQTTGRDTRENSRRDLKACLALSPAQVFEVMASVTGCSVSQILEKKRGRPWRSMGMYLVKRHCPIGLKKAGEIWGIDYSTLSMNAKIFSLLLTKNETLQQQAAIVEQRLSLLGRNGETTEPKPRGWGGETSKFET